MAASVKGTQERVDLGRADRGPTAGPGPVQALGVTYEHSRMTAAAALLRHSRRWVLAATSLGTGRLLVLVGTPYGLANARNSKTAKTQNEKLIQEGLSLLAGAGDLPARLGGVGDFNLHFQETAVIQDAFDSGYWLDAAAALADAVEGSPELICYNKDLLQ